MLEETYTPQNSESSAGSFSAFLPGRHRRIAIMGFAETVADAPVSDPSWELWAMNGFWRAAKPDFGIEVPEDRYALWFDMHSEDYIKAYGVAAHVGDQQQRWLEQPHPFPILSLQANPSWPSVAPYPIEAVIETFGRDYFTSTVAYMLAFALMQPDVAEVGLWGIDLMHASEYADQRPCAEFYLGWASARGIKVTLHEKSALLRQRFRYGYEPENPLLGELRQMLYKQAETTEKKLADLRSAHEQTLAALQTEDGSSQIIKHLLGRLETWERGGRL